MWIRRFDGCSMLGADRSCGVSGMFHMLSCFNLKSNVTLDDFRRSLDEFNSHLLEADLIQSAGPIGRRQRHEIMDTDKDRDHEYFFILSFRNRTHCDKAVDHFNSGDAATDERHVAVYSKIADEIFICWEDVAG